MNSLHNSEIRSVKIPFDAYGEDDPQFKIELIGLMIANVLELQEAAIHSYEKKSEHYFRSAVHKTKSTITLIGDQEFIEAIDLMKETFISQKNLTYEAIVSFGSFAGSMIKSLEHEILRLKTG